MPNETSTYNELKNLIRDLRGKISPEESLALNMGLERLMEDLKTHSLELEMQGHEVDQYRTSLRNTAQKFSDIYEFSPVGILSMDFKGRVIEMNNKASELLGHLPAAVKDLPFIVFFRGQEKSAFYQLLDSIAKEEVQSKTLEFCPVSNETAYKVLRLTAKHWFDHSLGRTLLLCSLEDITSLKLANRRLAHQVEIMHQISDLLIETDEDLTVTFFNEAMSQTLAWTPAMVLGKNLSTLLGEKTAFVRNQLRQIGDKGEVSMELELAVNGKVFFDVKARRVHQTGQDGFLLVLRDTSQRRIMEHDLERSRESFSSVVKQCPAGICITNEKGIFEYVNDAYAKFYGYREEELLGQHFTIVVPEANKQLLSDLHDKFLGEKTEIRGEWPVQNKLGQTKTILADAAYIIGEDDRPKKVTFVIDITARKQMEEQLRLTNATKDRLFAIIGHDLKSPFHTLISVSDLLVQRAGRLSPEKQAMFLEGLSRSAKQGFELLSNLLDWARSQTGNMVFDPQHVSLAESLNPTIELVSEVAAAKGILVENLLTSRTVWADTNMLATIARNLLSNAVKFSPFNARIQIYDQAAEENGRPMRRIFVRDWGVGISPENQAKLFSLFTHFSTIGTDDEKGTGLGLMLCKELLDRHGGSFQVSSAPGEGSTFSFSLPVDTAPA